MSNTCLNSRGSALLVALVVSVVGCIASLVTFSITSQSIKTSGKKKLKASLLNIAEAGSEDALATLRSGTLQLTQNGEGTITPETEFGGGKYMVEYRVNADLTKAWLVSTGMADSKSKRIEIELGVTLQNPMKTYPELTIWAVNDASSPQLHYHVLSEQGSGDYDPHVHIEGDINGIIGSTDIEALTIGPNGIIYFMNNYGNSQLYLIQASQMDKDQATPVTAEYIGNTGLSGDNEITSMQFVDGILYGIGKKSRKIHSINVSDGSVTEVAQLSESTFRTDGLTLGNDGLVYLNKTKSSNSELWKFTSFPDGPIEEVCDITGSGKIEGLCAHPDGHIYAADDEHWYKIDPESHSVAIMVDYNSDIEGMDFYYEAEEEDNENQGDVFEKLAWREIN